MYIDIYIYIYTSIHFITNRIEFAHFQFNLAYLSLGRPGQAGWALMHDGVRSGESLSGK